MTLPRVEARLALAFLPLRRVPLPLIGCHAPTCTAHLLQ